MLIQSAPTTPLRRATQQPTTDAPPPGPKHDDSVSVGNPPPEKGVAWGNVALLAGATALGAGAGIYAGLHTGLLSELVSVALLPGAAIGGAVLGAIAGEKYSPKFLGEYPAIGGGIYGGLIGAGIGVTQMFLAGDSASPLLAVSLGLSGAVAGAAGSLALLGQARDLKVR